MKPIFFYRKLYKEFLSNLNMQSEKTPFGMVLGKMVVTKEGKRLGFVKDITFETTSGELINIVLKDSTPYTKNLNLERTPNAEFLIPYSAIIAIGDFVIVSEEDLI
jgi:sporulation protein YlmC with PRC-barrel domain